MHRSNRPRRARDPRRARPWDDAEPLDIARIRGGARRTEVRRGIEWTVQPIRPERALKPYTCPGCGREVAVGTAHVVVWRADSIMGDDSALAERRHWHTPCWRIG